MERLTKRFDGWVMREGCHGPCRTCNGAKCADIFPMIDRLAAYEDTGLEPEEMSEYQHLCDSYAETGLDSKFVQFCIDATQNGLSMNRIRELAQAEKDGRLVVLPPNDPLTLEELREMDGEPVWVVFIPDADGETLALWALVSVDSDDGEVFLLNSLGGSSAYEEIWADVRAIYRRKPEEGTT